jgi:uncharacterized membrane protein YgcG
MKKLGLLLSVILILAVPSAASARTLATSDYYSRSIDKYTATYDIHADGSTDVTIDFLFNFNTEPGHGPYITYPTRMPYDDKNDRFYGFSNIEVSSPSGAPANLYADNSGGWLTIRVGDENIGDVSGVKEYILTYTITGTLNETMASELDSTVAPADDKAVFDEFYWNVIGSDWTIPIDDVTIIVKGDVGATDLRCYSGSFGSTDPCTSANLVDGVATVTQDHVGEYTGMSVAVAFPPGSFDTTPIVRRNNDFLYAFSLTPVTGVGFLVVLLAGIVLLSRAIRGKAMDEQYSGLTPGLTPVSDDDARIVKRDYDSPVAVQFQPPPGLRPGQLGTLIDERADVRDVTATIVDLAVRGYLRIDPVDPGKKKTDYTLVKLREADDAMVDYEKTLFTKLLGSADSVTLSSIKTTFASTLAKVQAEMYQNVTQLGWFRGNPSTARTAWGFAGFGIFALGVVLTWLAGAAGPWALIPLPIAFLGIMVIATIKAAPARKAEGTRVLAQTQGFERFLSTADGNKLRFEEGSDIFSMYLPFAIAFGVADKWSATFERLAAQGQKLAEPTWYGGHTYGTFWTTNQNFGNTMNSFVSFAGTAISAPTPGSSGGSGFGGGGGGGGFSGGGGGGGGGGGW